MKISGSLTNCALTVCLLVVAGKVYSSFIRTFLQKKTAAAGNRVDNSSKTNKSIFLGCKTKTMSLKAQWSCRVDNSQRVCPYE